MRGSSRRNLRTQRGFCARCYSSLSRCRFLFLAGTKKTGARSHGWGQSDPSPPLQAPCSVAAEQGSSWHPEPAPGSGHRLLCPLPAGGRALCCVSGSDPHAQHGALGAPAVPRGTPGAPSPGRASTRMLQKHQNHWTQSARSNSVMQAAIQTGISGCSTVHYQHINISLHQKGDGPFLREASKEGKGGSALAAGAGLVVSKRQQRQIKR